MKSMEALNNTITSSLQECDSHLQKMKIAYEKLGNQLPFQEGEFPLEDEVLSAHLDAGFYCP